MGNGTSTTQQKRDPVLAWLAAVSSTLAAAAVIGLITMYSRQNSIMDWRENVERGGVVIQTYVPRREVELEFRVRDAAIAQLRVEVEQLKLRIEGLEEEVQ